MNIEDEKIINNLIRQKEKNRQIEEEKIKKNIETQNITNAIGEKNITFEYTDETGKVILNVNKPKKINKTYFFYLAFNEAYKKKYQNDVLKAAKTMRLCKYIAGIIPEQHWEKLIDIYLSDNNPYILSRNHDIGLLAVDIQKYYNQLKTPSIKDVVDVAKVQAKNENKDKEKAIIEKQKEYDFVIEQFKSLFNAITKGNTIAQHNCEKLLKEIEVKYPRLYESAKRKFEQIRIKEITVEKEETPIFHDILKTDIKEKKDEPLPELKPEDLKHIKEKMEKIKKKMGD